MLSQNKQLLVNFNFYTKDAPPKLMQHVKNKICFRKIDIFFFDLLPYYMIIIFVSHLSLLTHQFNNK